jgi:hypothetical protein
MVLAARASAGSNEELLHGLRESTLVYSGPSAF